MPGAIVDKFTKDQLAEFVSESNSYKQVMLKLGYKTDNGAAYKTVKSRIEKYGISTAHFGTAEKIERCPENVFVENSTATQAVLRRWYVKGNYTEYKCAICGLLPVWQGKELVLTLDHINGHNKDDRLENLRWVCPNCDRQLPTFGRKNN